MRTNMIDLTEDQLEQLKADRYEYAQHAERYHKTPKKLDSFAEVYGYIVAVEETTGVEFVKTLRKDNSLGL